MIFGKKREKNAESVAVIGDAEISAVTEETLSPEAEEAIVPAEPEEPQDTKAIELENAEELAKEIPNSFIPGQFVNPANAKAHFDTTGPEIWEDTDGNVDVFVSCAGTGGTVTGAGRYLKSKNKDIQIVAVEPEESPVLSGGKAGSHGIQGIGAGFVPGLIAVIAIVAFVIGLIKKSEKKFEEEYALKKKNV